MMVTFLTPILILKVMKPFTTGSKSDRGGVAIYVKDINDFINYISKTLAKLFKEKKELSIWRF